MSALEKNISHAKKSGTPTQSCANMSASEPRLSREDKRELQKIRCELLTLAERVSALINRAAVKE